MFGIVIVAIYEFWIINNDKANDDVKIQYSDYKSSTLQGNDK